MNVIPQNCWKKFWFYSFGILLMLMCTSLALGQADKRSASLDRLMKATGNGASIKTNPSTGVPDFVRFSRDNPLSVAGGVSPEAEALAFLQAYGDVFGISDSARELKQSKVQTDNIGMKHVEYQQMYRGVEVFGGILRVHLDASNRISAVNGVFVPDLNLDPNPRLKTREAIKIARADLKANPPKDEEGRVVNFSLSELKAVSKKLYVYNDGLIRGVKGSNHLVYEIELTDRKNVREFIFVNAHSGKIVNRYSAIQDALFRILYEQNTGNQIWQEGDPFPGSLNQDQQNIVTFSGQAYYHFFNAFGRDSYDAAGAQMRSVNNDPTINCPNANWNGSTTNYCNGVTADDVVAHEWGHAYTQYTHNLIYQWQPGALNESYSDIWGDTVDLINGMGTDIPGGVRTVGVCSTFTTPVPVLTINAPPSIAGDYAAAGAAFGPVLTETGTTGNVVLADDGVGTPTDACTPLINGSQIAGNIALVDRGGGCSFVLKVKNAQNVGAIAVIVANNVVGPPGGMGGADPTITIPSVMVALSTGNLIKAELANGVNVTMHVTGGNTEDSYRWLVGEDATAFGSAIRDMWNPQCKSDPGKVSDAEYHCATNDAGGVHTNSGVPNHAYALLVDGGTYNGQTINAIGLVKAAHIYFQAQSVYQVPTSGFADHALALQASCEDLIGTELEGLSTSSTPAGPSGQIISSADCNEVEKVVQAVEFDAIPNCNFGPLLAKNPPPLCSSGYSASTVYLEDFESGLGSWTLTNQGVFAGWPGFDWAQSTSLPGGRSGAAAFGTDPDIGNCDHGAGDVSGVMRMEGGSIVISSGSLITPRLAFDHYVATEPGFDGGNIKISINGGSFTLIPSSAYIFNPHNTTLAAAPGNTSPLAGQQAFSGTDGGQVTGSWGQSQINLAALGVVPGNTIRLRYDNGMDGCTGNDGWYVDDVHVYTCPVATPPNCSSAAASPNKLWPPNHNFKNISVTGVTDPNNDTVSITINTIFQDEAVKAPNSGNTSPDGKGIGTSTAQVRAERVEGGNGRVYHISYTANDGHGGTCTGEVLVSVPPTINGTAIDDGALYDSTIP